MTRPIYVYTWQGARIVYGARPVRRQTIQVMAAHSKVEVAGVTGDRPCDLHNIRRTRKPELTHLALGKVGTVFWHIYGEQPPWWREAPVE